MTKLPIRTFKPPPIDRACRETQSAIARHVAVVSAFKFAQRDRLVRRLLERWVSELDPAVALGRGGEVLGLCDADCKLGDAPYIFNPFNPRAAG